MFSYILCFCSVRTPLYTICLYFSRAFWDLAHARYVWPRCCSIVVRHIYGSQCSDKTPEVTCAGQKLERFRRHIIHKCTQMYLFIKEPVCDTVDNRPGSFKTRAAAEGLARVIIALKGRMVAPGWGVSQWVEVRIGLRLGSSMYNYGLSLI